LRDQLSADGIDPAFGESGLEVTYADSLTEWLALQPDLQWIRNPGADRTARNAVVAMVRMTASF